MTRTDLTVMSLSQASRHKRDGFAAVITLEDPDAKAGDRLRFHKSPKPAHLILAVEDMDIPYPGYRLPTEDDAARILEFGRRFAGQPLLIHCQAGVARSPAAALLILTDRLGVGHELDALAHLIAIRPEAVPNRLLVAHGDRLLGCHGALVAAVAARDRMDPLPRVRRTRNFAERVRDAALIARCDLGLDALFGAP